MDGAKVERVLRGDEPGIVHLHGCWDRPESVILGIRSYEEVRGDVHAQTMQQAIRSLKTLLFVGCREGLLDPNFGALLEWSAKVFAVSEYRHFLLTRESEVTALQNQRLVGERIVVLSYGNDFGDLAPFLRGLRTGPGIGQKAQPSSPAPGQAALLPPAPCCLGREAEIEDLVSTLLATPALPVPLLGPPGIGKSAITLVALNDSRVANHYGKRRLFIRCDSATSREMLMAEIARTAGLQVGPNLEATLLAMLESAPLALAVNPITGRILKLHKTNSCSSSHNLLGQTGLNQPRSSATEMTAACVPIGIALSNRRKGQVEHVLRVGVRQHQLEPLGPPTPRRRSAASLRGASRHLAF
jgi:hypothetical protein